ncbi:MAG: tetratricopeptide repeat protein [Prevotella sp.]|nr:tetratricopeptide repeat protein [Prevotella sp.]
MLQTTRRLAECHYKTGNFKQALSIAATLPPDSMTHDDLRLVYFCLSPLRGTGGSADSLFYWGQRILKQYPMDAEVAADMAKRYIESEKPEIALKTATEYWLRDSTNVYVNRQLGYAQYLCGQYKEAINTYEQQLIRGDSSVIVLFPLGMCYYLTNDRPNAYIRLKQAAKATDYGNATCLAKLGIVAAQLGHAQESAEYLEKAINLFTPDPEVMALVYENLGDAHLQAGNMRAGIEAYRNCLNHNPEKPYYIYYEMGQAYGAIRDSANERKYFRLFLEETQKLKSLDGLEEAIAYAKRKVGLKK